MKITSKTTKAQLIQVLEEASANIAHMESTIIILQDTNTELEKRLKSANGSIRSLEESKDFFEARSQDLEKRLKDSCQIAEEVAKELQQEKEWHAETVQMLDAARKEASSNEELLKTNAYLEGKLKEAEGEIRTRMRDTEELLNKIRGLETNLAAYKREKAILTEKNTDLERQARSAGSSYRSTEEKLQKIPRFIRSMFGAV